MTGNDLRLGRVNKRWSQENAASKLGVSQSYLSLMEKGVRRVPDKLARKAVTVFALSPAALRMNTNLTSVQPKSAHTLAADLAALGYPGFSYLKAKRKKKNPGDVLLSALRAKCLEPRVAEALPWVLLQYPNLDWDSLVSASKLRDLQNKLGFVTSVARRVAEKRGENEKAELLRQQERVLDRSRLFLEDAFCSESLTKTERRWLETHRPAEAKHWRVLTDLSPEHLSYAS